MPSSRWRRLTPLIAVAVLAPAGARGQQPMSFAELDALPAPPPNHRIQYGAGPLQFGNLRLPKGNGPFPVVVFIHGGCWLSQYNIGHVDALEQALADSGFAVWSLEYRRVGDPGGGWPGTFQDIAQGADFVRTLAPTYKLDLSRLIAAGHSAGGAFALWLALRPKIPPSSEVYAANPLPIQGVLGLAPAPDLEGLSALNVCGGVLTTLMGGSPADQPTRYAAASPMQLAPVSVPSVLITGGQDRTWGPPGRAYYARAVAAGDTSVRLVDAPVAGHFDIIAPTSSTWPLVMRELRELAATIARRRPRPGLGA